MSSSSREDVPASVRACGPHPCGTLEALTVLAPENSSLWLLEPFPVRLPVQFGVVLWGMEAFGVTVSCQDIIH